MINCHEVVASLNPPVYTLTLNCLSCYVLQTFAPDEYLLVDWEVCDSETDYLLGMPIAEDSWGQARTPPPPLNEGTPLAAYS